MQICRCMCKFLLYALYTIYNGNIHGFAVSITIFYWAFQQQLIRRRALNGAKRRVRVSSENLPLYIAVSILTHGFAVLYTNKTHINYLSTDKRLRRIFFSC